MEFNDRRTAHIRVTQPRARNVGAAEARWRFEKNNTAYTPTNFCGAPLTTSDWDRRSAVAKKNARVAEEQVCPACLHAARAV